MNLNFSEEEILFQNEVQAFLEKELTEDLVSAAHNNAKNQLKSKTSEEISKATGGRGMPGFKWPL